jgi:hypothetical protein
VSENLASALRIVVDLRDQFVGGSKGFLGSQAIDELYLQVLP